MQGDGASRGRRVAQTLVVVLLAVLATAIVLYALSRPTVLVRPAGSFPERGWPPVPRADAAAIELPPGYRAEVFVRDLGYPTAIAWDDAGAA